MATAARFWDARQKSGGASTSAFAHFIGASIFVGLRRARGRRRCTSTWLVCSRLALTPVAVLFARFALHKNVMYWASITIPLVGLALHQHALCRLSLTWLGFHAELPM
jgi:hypothetical protein